jgi:hypothetical protein
MEFKTLVNTEVPMSDDMMMSLDEIEILGTIHGRKTISLEEVVSYLTEHHPHLVDEFRPEFMVSSPKT